MKSGSRGGGGGLGGGGTPPPAVVSRSNTSPPRLLSYNRRGTISRDPHAVQTSLNSGRRRGHRPAHGLGTRPVPIRTAGLTEGQRPHSTSPGPLIHFTSRDGRTRTQTLCQSPVAGSGSRSHVWRSMGYDRDPFEAALHFAPLPLPSASLECCVAPGGPFTRHVPFTRALTCNRELLQPPLPALRPRPPPRPRTGGKRRTTEPAPCPLPWPRRVRASATAPVLPSRPAERPELQKKWSAAACARLRQLFIIFLILF